MCTFNDFYINVPLIGHMHELYYGLTFALEFGIFHWALLALTSTERLVLTSELSNSVHYFFLIRLRYFISFLKRNISWFLFWHIEITNITTLALWGR